MLAGAQIGEFMANCQSSYFLPQLYGISISVAISFASY